MATRRSAAFKAEVDDLIEKTLMRMYDGGKIGRIIEILRNNTTDNRCMVNAAEDEPVFVFKAKDITSDKVVDHWCELQIEHHVSTNSSEPLTKVSDARMVAEAMRKFPGRKWPD